MDLSGERGNTMLKNPMKLVCKTTHMANKAILVNGRKYKINAIRMISVSHQEDIDKLLSTGAWEKYDPKRHANMRPPQPKKESALPREAGRAPRTPKPKDEPPQVPEQATDAGDAQSEGESEPVAAPAVEEAPLEPEEPPEGNETEPEGQDEVPGEEAPEDEPLTAETLAEEAPVETPGEWPDPDVSMKKDYLQEMAKAYEVEFEAKTTKTELVKLVHGKMYG